MPGDEVVIFCHVSHRQLSEKKSSEKNSLQRRSAIAAAEPKHFGARRDWPCKNLRNTIINAMPMPCRTMLVCYATGKEEEYPVKQDGVNKECA
jgi:hypothetical protein